MFLVTKGLGSTLLPTEGLGTYDTTPVVQPPDLENQFLRSAETNYLVDVQILDWDTNRWTDQLLAVNLTNRVTALTSAGLVAVDKAQLIRPLQDGVVKIELSTPQRLRILNEP